MNTKFLTDLRQRGVTHIGLPWYEAADFEAAMAIMEDRHLFSTYERWLSNAMRVEDDARAAGLIPVRAVIHPEAFINFCRVKGLHIDASGRNDYASWVAYKTQSGGEH